MTEILNNIDTQIFLFFNGTHSSFFDEFMAIFTGRFIWVPMYAAIALLIWKTARAQKFLFYIVALALAVTLTDQICATVIRPMVERLRPSNLENELSNLTYVVNGYRGGSYGFPSCHAANSFALVSFMVLMVRNRTFRAAIIGWGLLNSYTRLYLGVHYPGDLFVGAVIGCLCGAAMFLITRRLADPHTDCSKFTERAAAPMISYHSASKQGAAVAITRGISISALNTVFLVGGSTLLYIIVCAAVRSI